MYNYENVKLEKGLYNLSGKSFKQALEERDPRENYKGSPLYKLDAFERQLKRFDIKVCGNESDTVEKFFATTESAVLFPEFVRRCIQQGIDESVLGSIVAVHTITDSNTYNGLSITDDSALYSTAVAEAATIPSMTIKQGSIASAMSKIARVITTSYEVLRNQKLDVFGVTLKAVGKKIASALTKNAITALASATTATSIAGTDLAYSDLTTLYGSFTDFDMKAIIVSPATAATILAMDEMSDLSFGSANEVCLPFGTKIIKTPQIDDTTIIAVDNSYALEFASCTDLVIETDKLIDRQLDRIAVSIRSCFKTVFTDAVKKLTLE